MSEDIGDNVPSTKQKRAKKRDARPENVQEPHKAKPKQKLSETTGAEATNGSRTKIKKKMSIKAARAEEDDSIMEDNGSESDGGFESSKALSQKAKKQKRNNINETSMNNDSEPAEAIANGTKLMEKKKKKKSKSSDSDSEDARPKSSKRKNYRCKDSDESSPLAPRKKKKKKSNGAELGHGNEFHPVIEMSTIIEKMARAKQMRTRAVLSADELALWNARVTERRERQLKTKQELIDKGHIGCSLYVYDFPTPPEVTETERLYTSCLDLIQDEPSGGCNQRGAFKLEHSFDDFRNSMITIKNGGLDMNAKEPSFTAIMKKARLDCILPIFQEQLRYINIGGDKISLAELIYETNQQIQRKKNTQSAFLATSSENEDDEAGILFFAALFEKIHVSRSIKTGEVVLGMD